MIIGANHTSEGMTSVPRFLSLEFHVRFFPALLRHFLRPREKVRTGFAPSLEFPVLFVVCCVLIVAGIPMAVDEKSIAGWVMGGLGAAGLAALVISAIAAHDAPPHYEAFLTGVFISCVMLGLTAGIFAGALRHSLPLGLAVGTAGLAAGYMLGILAGLQLQRLGWLAPLLNGLAALMTLGMLVVDLVLLPGVLS